jgi:mono/diheme cytochrome c family protein
MAIVEDLDKKALELDEDLLRAVIQMERNARRCPARRGHRSLARAMEEKMADNIEFELYGADTIVRAAMWRNIFVSLSIVIGLGAPNIAAADSQIERGKYLVTVGGCSDCHTPGTFLGRPDTTRFLGGSDVGFALPDGVFVGRNLTPDKETGLGNWSDEQIIKAFTTGQRPDGRTLAPIMPWPALSQLTVSDAQAIVAFLRSIPAVKNQVPGPFAPNDKPSVLVFTIVPGDVYASMPKPPPPK